MRTPKGYPDKRFVRRTQLLSVIIQVICSDAHLDKTHSVFLASREHATFVLLSAWNMHHLQNRAIPLAFDEMMLEKGVNSSSIDGFFLTSRVFSFNPMAISCVNGEVRQSCEVQSFPPRKEILPHGRFWSSGHAMRACSP